MATYNFITETGVVIPDASAILTDVQQEFMEALGLPEIPDPSSAEGRMIDAEVTSRISVARNNALVANQLNPNLSTGVFLDSHLAFIGSRRDPAERSSADCLLAGVPGTPIPAGQFAEDENRNLWQFASSVTLDGTGQATATFQAVEFGPITADPNTITKIVSGVVGWETITNPSEAVPGKLEQSDISARRQRLLELGKNARSNSYAIIAAVSALEGVSGVRFLENFKSTTETLSNVELAPHSTWLCVEGGVDAQIAEAYYTSRTAGSGFNGDVTVNYTDPYSKQIIPVQFDRPTNKPLICRITVRIGGTASVDDIRRAVEQYAAGDLGGELGFYLGENSSPFAVAAGVNNVLSGVFVVKCELAEKSVGSGGYTTDTIINQIYEKASLVFADVEVVTV